MLHADLINVHNLSHDHKSTWHPNNVLLNIIGLTVNFITYSWTYFKII